MKKRRLSRVLVVGWSTAIVAALVPLVSATPASAAAPTDPVPVLMPTAAAATAQGASAAPDAASQPNITYHGGAIQRVPKVYVNFWHWPSPLSSTEATYQSKLTGFLSNLGGTSLKDVDTQYLETARGRITNPTGLLKGTWSDTTAIPTAPTQTDLANAALRTASHFGVSDPDALYLIATPHAHNTAGFGTDFCGWHTYTGTTAFINLPYMLDVGSQCNRSSDPYAPVTMVAYHEVTEANTDPFLAGWYEGNYDENADKCAWGDNASQPAEQQRLFGGAFYWVQPVWSNVDGQCEFFYLPNHGAIASSAASSLHSASASCAFDHGYLNNSIDGHMWGSVTTALTQAPLSSSVTCSIQLRDSTASDGGYNIAGVGGPGSANTIVSRSDVPYGAKGSNSLCVSGWVWYGTETLEIPERCSVM